jgi:hypothetical protein
MAWQYAWPGPVSSENHTQARGAAAAAGDQIDGGRLHPALQRRIGQAPPHGPGVDARLERGQHPLAQLGISRHRPSFHAPPAAPGRGNSS